MCSNVAQIAASNTICVGGSTYSHTPVTTIAKANPALPTTSAARKPPSAMRARSNHIQRKSEPHRQADACRNSQQTLLPIAPGEKFQHQQTHATGHVRGEQHDKRN